MKKTTLIASLLLMTTTSCTSLFNNNLFGTNENRHSNDRYSHTTQPASGHVTQQTGNTGYYGYNNRTVKVGTIVNSLPSKNVKTATVNGQKLYLYNGVYYQSIRTNSGYAYKVVGYQY